MAKIMLNSSWCKGCGICADFCPTNVLKVDMSGRLIIVDEEACISCMLCELRCPDIAIEIKEDQHE